MILSSNQLPTLWLIAHYLSRGVSFSKENTCLPSSCSGPNEFFAATFLLCINYKNILINVVAVEEVAFCRRWKLGKVYKRGRKKVKDVQKSST